MYWSRWWVTRWNASKPAQEDTPGARVVYNSKWAVLACKFLCFSWNEQNETARRGKIAGAINFVTAMFQYHWRTPAAASIRIEWLQHHRGIQFFLAKSTIASATSIAFLDFKSLVPTCRQILSGESSIVGWMYDFMSCVVAPREDLTTTRLPVSLPNLYPFWFCIMESPRMTVVVSRMILELSESKGEGELVPLGSILCFFPCSDYCLLAFLRYWHLVGVDEALD